jgi:hypothetical protein
MTGSCGSSELGKAKVKIFFFRHCLNLYTLTSLLDVASHFCINLTAFFSFICQSAKSLASFRTVSINSLTWWKIRRIRGLQELLITPLFLKHSLFKRCGSNVIEGNASFSLETTATVSPAAWNGPMLRKSSYLPTTGVQHSGA